MWGDSNEDWLQAKIDRLESEVTRLGRELSKVTDERDHAEARVRNELEPRLKRDALDYDRWALSPERNSQ